MINEHELAHEVPDDVRYYTFHEALEEGELTFYLPVQWSESGSASGDGLGGPVVEDPLTIYASWDVNGNDERVTFKTTLQALLEDTYEILNEMLFPEHAPPGEPVLDEDGIKIFEQIRSGLMRELQRVDEWIEKAKQEEEQ